MNLEYPLDDGYFSFKHIQIIKCKEHVGYFPFRSSLLSVGTQAKLNTQQ
jgi:hypothetical protein